MSSAASLNDSMRLIFPDLPAELVPAGERQRLSDVASMLAPIHCAGFECRLGAGPSPVDLQQRILASDNEPARLAHHIAAGPLAPRAAWQRISALCQSWQREDSVLNTAIRGCWLELDSGGSEPSVFLSLRPLLGLRHSGAEVVEIADTAAEQLIREPLPQSVAGIVRSCVDACPEGAGATDLGFMLGRRADAIRLVVGPFRAGNVATYLSHVAELGGSPPIERLVLDGLALDTALSALPDSVEQIVVSLDVATAVLARVGLEYFPGGEPGDKAPWVELLDALVGADLCTVEKRVALLQWPGYLEPGNTEGPWPESLLVGSLLRGVDQFSVLGRRLNHVKIVCRPERATEAKAYFGFGPLWLHPGETREGGLRGGTRTDLRGAPETPQEAALRTPQDAALQTAPNTPLRTALQIALRRATDFLLEARNPEGLWLDFESVVGGSDLWVSAYTGAILATLSEARAREAAERTWDALCGRSAASGGWSYNRRLPADADATVWALRLARAVGSQSSGPARRGRRFMGRHVCPDGSIASYAEADLSTLRKYLGDGDKRALCVGHDCVTAAAAVLPEHAGRATDYLVRAQHPGGWWEGYWWSDHEYATALVVDGLLTAGGLLDTGGSRNADGSPTEDGRKARLMSCVNSAATWADARFAPNGVVQSRALGGASPFATALCCRILLAPRVSADAPASVSRGIDWLVRHQLADGSWQESALMRVPPAYALAAGTEPRETFLALDRRRIFTTATVLWMLGLALARNEAGYSGGDSTTPVK